MGENLLSVVGDIYQSATDQASADMLATRVARVFDSESCLMYFRRLKSGQMPMLSGLLCGTENFNPKNLSAYADYYHERDEWYERGWRKGVPAIVLGQELVDTQAILRTEWSDYLKATDTLHVLGTQFRIDGNLLGIIGIHRAPGRPEFGESDRHKMALLLPHFQRSMQMRECLAISEQRSALTLELLDRLAVAVMLVNADGSMVFANRSADRMLQKPCALTVVQGVLQARYAKDAKSFAHLLAEAAQTGSEPGGSGGGTAYLTLPMGKRQPVLIAPMQRASLGMNGIMALAAVICSGGEADNPSTEAYFIRRYGLTRAEARLLSALVAGQTLADYADHTYVAISTVRTYMKNLFAKIGCRRQADVVRVVLSDPMARLISMNASDNVTE